MHAGFAMTGTEVRTADVCVDDKDKIEVTTGMKQPAALLLLAALPPALLQCLQESRTSGY